MRAVGTGEEVRALDRRAIDDIGVPSVALMELAAHGVALAVREKHGAEASRGVVVAAGPGNNGGDGWAAARWLQGWGFPVSVWPVGGEARGDAVVQRQAAMRLGVPVVGGPGGAALVVDALLGTGLDRPVTGAFAAAIDAVNRLGVPVVAVDLPSGLSADTGAELGIAVRATRTVTFGVAKRGLYGEPGADLAGVVEVVDIGLGQAELGAEVPDAVDLAPLWPRRDAGDHKTSSGHLLVLAGSRNLAGAAVLACRGALACGAGLVTLAVPGGAVPRLASLPPEVMVRDCGRGDVLEPPPDALLDRKTAVLAGPGLGGGAALPEALRAWLVELWRHSKLPVAFDADALPCAGDVGAGPRVVTPHPGEAARMLGLSAVDVQMDRFSAAAALMRNGATTVLKGRYSLVASPLRPLSVNPTGNAVLATGGSGDVLAGVLSALLARGVPARDAARLATYVHGLAADLLVGTRSQGWTAGDVADALPDAVETLLGSAS